MKAILFSLFALTLANAETAMPTAPITSAKKKVEATAKAASDKATAMPSAVKSAAKAATPAAPAIPAKAAVDKATQTAKQATDTVKAAPTAITDTKKAAKEKVADTTAKAKDKAAKAVTPVGTPTPFWISGSGKRHNSKCTKVFGQSKGGHYGTATEGVACKNCGG